MPEIAYAGPQMQTVHFLVSEAHGYRSREPIIVSSGAGVLPRGMVLGQRTRGAASAPVTAALAGNTGNGTIGTTSVDAASPAGKWRIRFESATVFVVYGPDGIEQGRGAPGAAFNGTDGINFTVTAGGTPFAAGDGFDFTVAFAAGTLEYVPATEAATDGSNVATAILYQDVDATSVDVKATALVRDCEVQRAALSFSGTPSNAFKAACYAALAAKGIAFR